MGELLLFCCTIIFAIVIYLIYNKEKPNYVLFSERKNQDSYRKAIRNKYMKEENDREYINNIQLPHQNQPHHRQSYPQDINQLKQSSYYDNYNKPINSCLNNSLQKEYMYFNSNVKPNANGNGHVIDNNNKTPNAIQDSLITDKKKTKIGGAWNDNYDWLLHNENSITKGIRVIKADEFLSKPLDTSVSNTKNVLLNTTAIQNMFKSKEPIDKNSPEAKNVIRKLDFNE